LRDLFEAHAREADRAARLAAEEWAAFRPRTVLVDRENRAVEVLEGRIEGP
jgi:hypothetical protein